MMKLKGSEIALLIAALLVVGLVVYNFMEGGIATPKTATSVATPAERAAESEFSEDPEELREQMKRADDEMVKRYMRSVIKRELPEDYETPQYIVEAGTIAKSVEAIGAQFPEFYKKGGNELIHAVRRHPVKYVEMIEHTRAYRNMYRYQLDENVIDTTGRASRRQQAQ